LTVNVKAVDANGNPVSGAKFSVDPIRPRFPLGTAINQAIINDPVYQKWFASRFTVTTFENEMKWYSTEYTPGHEDYSAADAMLAFVKKYGIQVRGHNVFWDDPK
jgi:GH35 family endo-1,4-beta-xylanase